MIPTMGKQDESKPVSAPDKAMSVRHKANRRRIEAMPEKTQQEKVTKLKAGIRFNKRHAAEHHKAEMRDVKILRKLGTKRV